MYFIKRKHSSQLQQTANKSQLRSNLASRELNTVRQELHQRNIKKQKRTTHGTWDDQQTASPDLGRENRNAHDGERAEDDAPLTILTTCKKTAHPGEDSHAQHEPTTAPEEETCGIDHGYTKPLPPRPGGLEEVAWHPEVSTRRSKRGSTTTQGARGTQPTTTQMSPQKLHTFEAMMRHQQPRAD
jgi:hypothetical protein